MGAIANVIYIIVKIILAPIKALLKLILWFISIISSIVTVLTSFPANVILIIGFVIIVVMWIWPNPFAIVYVLYYEANRLFTNLILIPVNAIIPIFYNFLVPLWNDILDGFFLFWGMFKNGICADDAIETCKGFESLMTSLTIVWYMFGNWFNMIMYIIMSIYWFLNTVLSPELRRSVLDQEITYCHTPACDDWDGTPRYDRDFRGDIIYIFDDDRRSYVPQMIENTAPFGINNMRQYLTEVEVLYIQILAKVAIWTWEFVFETIMPFFVQTLAFIADLFKLYYLLFQEVVEIFVTIAARLLSKLVYVLWKAVETVFEDPNALDFEPEYYEGNLTDYANENEDDFASYVGEYMVDTSYWMLENITIGSPHVTKFYLWIVRTSFVVLSYVVQIPDTVFGVIDKLYCMFENFIPCLPFSSQICGQLFAPFSGCTVFNPICRSKVGPYEDEHPSITYPGYYYLQDTFKLMYHATWFGTSTLKVCSGGTSQPGLKTHLFQGCRNYKTQFSSEPIYLDNWWKSEDDDPLQNDIEAGIYRYPDPEKLHCSDYKYEEILSEYNYTTVELVRKNSTWVYTNETTGEWEWEEVGGYWVNETITHIGFNTTGYVKRDYGNIVAPGSTESRNATYNWWWGSQIGVPPQDATNGYIGFIYDVYPYLSFDQGRVYLKNENCPSCAAGMRPCATSFEIESPGLFFPWVFDLADSNWFFEGIWGMLNWLSDIFADSNMWRDMWTIGRDSFEICVSLLGDESCPCSACETDPSQLMHWLNYVFSWGDSSLSGVTMNYIHPDPSKRCVSVSPFYSLAWNFDEYFDLFEECKMCPTRLDLDPLCTCNEHCPCTTGSGFCTPMDVCIEP